MQRKGEVPRGWVCSYLSILRRSVGHLDVPRLVSFDKLSSAVRVATNPLPARKYFARTHHCSELT